MKKIFTFFLALVASVSAIYASDTPVDGIWYDFDNLSKTASVTYRGYSPSFYDGEYSGSVVIPSSVTYLDTTYSVTSIGKEAFSGCSSLTSVTIGESVTSIGEWAFYNCSSLTSVTIGESVKSIKESAFRNCSKLTSVTIGESVKNIGNYAFSGCSSLTSVTIGKSVTSIGKEAFSGCSSLTSVTIGESVKNIGNYAFSGCSSLTSVTIGESVTSIGYAAFYNCSSLTSVTIPNSVTSIGSGAFEDCSSLTSINIPTKVTCIEASSFRSCSKLTSVTIPNSVTIIRSHAFDGCSSLTSVTIGKSVKSIEESAFYGCSSLTSVTINSDIIVSEDYEYDSNISHIFGSQVTEYIIGNHVKGIGSNAFRDCSSLTSVTIGESVTSIGKDAFYGCSSLTKNNYTGDIAGWCNIKFGNYSANPMRYSHNFYINDQEIKDLVIPNSVTSIGYAAFVSYSSLTSVTIGDGVTSIGECAFHYCSSLTSVTIGESVTSIGASAFERCSALTSVTIGESVTSIGEYAFYGCSSLTKTNYTGDIAGWCNIEFGYYDTNPMYYSHNFYINDQEIKDLVIPNNVTSIGEWAFYNCSSLTSVTIGESVTHIGNGAFRFCSSLSSVTINSDAIVSEDYKYDDNISDIFGSQVTEYIIGNHVKGIGFSAFSGCSATSVTIGDSVTSIGEWAFKDCSSLTSITCKAATPPTVDYYTFSNVSTSIPVYVPCESIQSYREHNQWGRFQNLQCVKPEDPKPEDPQDSEMCLNSADERAVFFQGEEFGTSANVYMWDPANDNKELLGSWPGSAATHLGDGKFKFVIPTSVTGDPSTWMIIWNNGIGGTKTKDLTFTMHGLYNMSGVQSVITTLCDGGEIPVDPKPEDPKPEDPQDSEMCLNSADERAVFFQGEEFGTSANVYMWDPANDNKELLGSWPGSAATHLGDGKFKFVIPTSVTGDPSTWMIIWNNGIGGTKTKDLTFIMHGLYNISGVQSVITTLCDGGEIPVDPKPEDPEPEDPQDSVMCLNSADERAVFFQGEEFGTSANVYMWDPANDNKELLGSWPGSAATHLGDGKFKFVIPTSVTGDPSTWMIIWNNGIGGTKTKDLTFTMHGLYNMSGVQSVITTLCDGSNTDDPNEEVITCAEAVSICQQTGTTATTKEYTIRGYVTKIEAAYSEQYDNITFWMADTSPMQMDNSSNSVTSLSDYPNIALGKSTTASSSENSGTLPEYINDGNFNTRWSSEWQDNEYITIDLEQYSFIDHITLHWETAYASQFAILITDEQPSSSALSSPLPSSATCYQSSGDVQTIPVAKSGRYITLIGIERATAYGISLYELEAYGMPLLQAYCVKPIHSTDKYVQIGDYVEAVGTLVNYGGTTPEINAGGTYTILTTTTAVENTHIQSSMTNCQKIIRNGQLIILRDGKTYNVMGLEL